MYCSNCGTRMEDNAAFCPACGTAVNGEAQPGQGGFPDPTVLPTPEQGRIDPRSLTPEPQIEQDIDINSVVEDLNRREPEPMISKNGFTEQDMAWFTDMQPQTPPQPQYPNQTQYQGQPQYRPPGQSANPQQYPQQPVQTNPGYFSQAPVAVDLTPKRSNVLLGILGAVVFSLIGCAVWVIIGSLGYVSYLGGLALSLLTVTGYKLLGKKFDIAGVLCCLAVVALAVFVSNIFIYAFTIAADPELMEIMGYLGYDSFGDIFFHFFDMVKDVDAILEAYSPGDGTMMQEFIGDLAIGYVFAGIAFIVVAASQFRASRRV